VAELINAQDLRELKITPLEGGAFFVSACCAVCDERVSFRLTAHDVETNSQVEQACSSGSDWPNSFQLSARYSPSETDDPSGVDVWGEIFGSPERERD